jgi:hypothetical protein
MCSLYREISRKESQELFCEKFSQVFDFVQAPLLELLRVNDREVVRKEIAD